MGDKLVDPAIIKKTQDTLQHIIKVPPLTDKLLNRPPVQFIQDIVKSAIKNTGYMEGLYTAEELDGAYIKASKENKLLFLTKFVTFVG
jgi:TRAF3-interacting protein 1